MTDYYQTLGVNKTATQEEIKQAYRKLAGKHHPDRGGDTKQFQKIQEAYDTLGDQNKRSNYDTPRPQMNEWQFHSGSPFDDMFTQFGFGTPRRQSPKNKSMNVQVTVTLEEILSGKKVVGNIQLPSGRDQYIELQIPPGIKNGDTVRFTGLGDDSVPGIPRGDLIAVIRELRHNRFTRNGMDIHAAVKASVFDIIIGGKIKIQTLDDKTLEIDIPKGFSLNSSLCCNGHGVPHPNYHSQRGNLFVNLEITIPQHFSSSDADILADMRTRYPG